mgnify:CR=1 FL=1
MLAFRRFLATGGGRAYAAAVGLYVVAAFLSVLLESAQEAFEILISIGAGPGLLSIPTSLVLLSIQAVVYLTVARRLIARLEQRIGRLVEVADVVVDRIVDVDRAAAALLALGVIGDQPDREILIRFEQQLSASEEAVAVIDRRVVRRVVVKTVALDVDRVDAGGDGVGEPARQAAGEIAHQQRAIVPLQPRGSRTPLFAIPGHNGDVFCYRALAQHLGSDQPLFGLQPPGVDGQAEPLRSVEALAAYFASQVRGFMPNGPYGIAGYCAGGAIAFELALQLQRAGATVDFVALFASPHPSWYGPVPQLRYRLEHPAARRTRSLLRGAPLDVEQPARDVDVLATSLLGAGDGLLEALGLTHACELDQHRQIDAGQHFDGSFAEKRHRQVGRGPAKHVGDQQHAAVAVEQRVARDAVHAVVLDPVAGREHDEDLLAEVALDVVVVNPNESDVLVLDLDIAINLDGGGSTGILVANPRELISPTRPIPFVILVHPR